MSRKISLKCSECGNSFFKENKEYTRRSKQGKTNFFCNRSCARSFLNKNPTKERTEKQKLVTKMASKAHSEKRKSKKGEFSYYVRTAKRRKHDYNITLEYLAELWEKQKGKCAITGLDMEVKKANKKQNYFKLASLDRIDSDIGYMKDNVQFVCLPINLAKSNKSDIELKNFLIEVIESLN